MIGIIVVAVVLWLAGRLRERYGGWNATFLALLTGAVAVGVAYAALPRIDEMPPDFPATVLWQFRLSSFAAQAVLWAILGIVFGALTDRALRVRTRPTTAHKSVAASTG